MDLGKHEMKQSRSQSGYVPLKQDAPSVEFPMLSSKSFPAKVARILSMDLAKPGTDSKSIISIHGLRGCHSYIISVLSAQLATQLEERCESQMKRS